MFTRFFLSVLVFSVIPLFAGYSIGTDKNTARAQQDRWMALAGAAIVADLAIFSAWALNQLWG